VIDPLGLGSNKSRSDQNSKVSHIGAGATCDQQSASRSQCRIGIIIGQPFLRINSSTAQ
jgi:hypothetical protein